MNLINEIKNPRVYALGFFDYIYIFIKQKSSDKIEALIYKMVGRDGFEPS